MILMPKKTKPLQGLLTLSLSFSHVCLEIDLKEGDHQQIEVIIVARP